MTIQTLTAIIPAAGCGERAALKSNKILSPLAGKTVLGHVLRALAEAKVLLQGHQIDLSECVIAARPDEFDRIKTLYATDNLPFSIRLVPGGKSRQESVSNAAQTVVTDWIMIHDAARPLLTAQLTASVCQSARHHGSAIAAMPVSDTVKYATLDMDQPSIKSTLERNRVWLAQTPQVFPRQLLKLALKAAAEANFEATDCAALVERLGQLVALVPSETENFKITYAQDLERAEYILKERGQ